MTGCAGATIRPYLELSFATHLDAEAWFLRLVQVTVKSENLLSYGFLAIAMMEWAKENSHAKP